MLIRDSSWVRKNYFLIITITSNDKFFMLFSKSFSLFQIYCCNDKPCSYTRANGSKFRMLYGQRFSIKEVLICVFSQVIHWSSSWPLAHPIMFHISEQEASMLVQE